MSSLSNIHVWPVGAGRHQDRYFMGASGLNGILRVQELGHMRRSGLQLGYVEHGPAVVAPWQHHDNKLMVIVRLASE